MSALFHRRLGVLAAFLLGLLPLLHAADPAPKPQLYKGQVVPLASYLEKHGAKLDKEASPQWYALVGDEGKVYPLVKDDGGRMFFKDERLLNRPMQLTARPVGATNFLQVFQVHSLKNGQLHEVYYWCDICAIKRFEKKDCDCCGAPMVLEEAPVK